MSFCILGVVSEVFLSLRIPKHPRHPFYPFSAMEKAVMDALMAARTEGDSRKQAEEVLKKIAATEPGPP